MAESMPVPKLIVLEPQRSRSQPGPAKSADLRWARVEEFFRSRELASNTHKVYARELRRFLSWTEKSWPEVTHRDIDHYKEYLQSSPSARGGKPSAATINRALSALQSFFKWLTAKDYIPRNPTLTLEKPKADPLLPQELKAVEIEALYGALAYRGETEARDTALLRVLEHGLRASEVAALNVGDYEGNCLHIKQAKAGSVGSVPLFKQARQALDAYLGWRLRQGLPTERDSPLFLSCSNNSKGQRLSYWGIYKFIEKLAALAGVENCHPHRLRHTFATKLVMKGMDTMLARQLTRHKSESSFTRYSKRALELQAHQQFYALFGEEEREGEKE
ncbi:Mobile element protein [uncultured Synechococcales cyanobacterium]|uniref:Mobile element protein n=1 Tax=uncultured Synechococcales cyanobacterium TaxID=1936017 RepID=A0A6J4UZY9_9CYAN|nr:Mobile element protein [uncultured Synechococcales cyanobacterium]